MAARSAPPVAKRRVGRPRQITLEQVIAAGVEIGLERVDMVSVAQRLGIGVATLYGYVTSRDHLVRLIGDRLSQRPAIEDRGQSWEDVLRDHAERTYATYRANPQLIVQLMAGLLGDLTESEYVEALLRTLAARGLAPDAALTLFLHVNQLVLGAAVGRAYVQSLIDRAGGPDRRDERIAADCARLARPHLRAGLDLVDLPHLAGDFHPALERLIEAQRARTAVS